MPSSQRHSGQLLGPAIRPRDERCRDVRWRTEYCGNCRAVNQIADGADCVEELFMVFGGSLPLLEGYIPISRDSIGKPGSVSERQESHGRAAHAAISF
jgi:hypothetical protein